MSASHISKFIPVLRSWRLPMLGVSLLFCIVAAVAVARPAEPEAAVVKVVRLAPMHAIPMRVDTVFLGGYARGSFADALQTVASDLSSGEQTMVGRHLDRMFAGALGDDDLVRGGRLRLAYERAVRPDGSTRSLRVLAAEAAVDGQLHTAFFYEDEGKPGYFDAQGRSMDAHAWIGPVAAARVSSPFGLRRMHPILRRVLPHTGIDYAARSGTAVRATADGSVSSAGRRGGYGNLVEIQHPNGYTTRYAHLSRVAPGIAANHPVRQGEVIGYVGMTGLATGPHLHYEVRRRGQPVDPATSVLATSAARVAHDDDWRTEQRRLARLLARAPRLLERG